MSKGPDIQLLVTHQNPDLDAIGAVWLWMRFGGRRFENVSYYFVSAGSQIADDVLEAKEMTREETIHVDTGMGPFDHHQPDNDRRDSATLRVYEYLVDEREELENDAALLRLVELVNEIDHFAECYWPEADADRYELMVSEVLKGLRSKRHFSDREMLEFGMVCLDGVYTSLKMKVSAEEDLDEKAYEIETKWGKGLAIENQNDEVMKLAQKRGYQVVIRKDADRGGIRIKAVPEKGIDLTPVWEQVKELDDEGTWFLHQSKAMLLNGSEKGEHTPTPLELKTVVEIVKNVT